MNRMTVAVLTVFVYIALFPMGPIAADEVNIPHNFSPGTPAKASEVNENFAAAENAIDDNANQITALKAALNTKQNKITPNVYIFTLNQADTGFGSSSVDEFQPLMRDGVPWEEKFKKTHAESKIYVFYQDILSPNLNKTCFLQVRIDGEPSGDSYSPPIIMATTRTVPSSEFLLSSLGVFTELPAGERKISLYYRSADGTTSCSRNPGRLPVCQITVMEMP